MIDICNKVENDHNFQRIGDMGREMMSQGVAAYASLSAFNKARNYAISKTTDEDAKALLRGVRSNQLRLIQDNVSMEEQIDNVLFDSDSFKYAMHQALSSMAEEDKNYLNSELKFQMIPFGKMEIKFESLDDFKA